MLQAHHPGPPLQVDASGEVYFVEMARGQPRFMDTGSHVGPAVELADKRRPVKMTPELREVARLLLGARTR